MNPFPEDYELIELFESFPEVLDENVPWYYNNIKFSLRRNDDVLECWIEPAYHTIYINLRINTRTIYELKFENVKGLKVEKYKDRESLNSTV